MSKRLMKGLGVVLLALSFMLAACSNSTNTKEEAAVEAQESDAIKETTKVVQDMFGEVTIPAESKNMLVTSSIYAEYLIEMGITPQMVVVVPEIEPAYRASYFEEHGVKMIEGVQYQYNYEQLLSLAPDLIIARGAGMEQKEYDELSKVAPTVSIDSNSEMEDAMPKLAELFNKKAETEKILKEFDEKAQKAKQKMEQALGNKTVLVLRVEHNRYRYLGAQAGDSSRFFYQTLGLNIPDILKDSKDWFTPFSLEMLPDINPDYVFLEQRILKDYDTADSMKNLENSSLWNNLNAVKNNHVFPLNTNDFVQGTGPIGSGLLMDYIVERLVP
ncbi:ABC transporter substrate-binding protein [Paenibacillus sp. KS-LC4]|uniref:ABC transporter substrate-binding protein n=1 Tax=Paenibacillus sp. KS-LC4 TaxID=2979727 RepID=UPI0030CB82BF